MKLSTHEKYPMALRQFGGIGILLLSLLVAATAAHHVNAVRLRDAQRPPAAAPVAEEEAAPPRARTALELLERDPPHKESAGVLSLQGDDAPSLSPPAAASTAESSARTIHEDGTAQPAITPSHR